MGWPPLKIALPPKKFQNKKIIWKLESYYVSLCKFRLTAPSAVASTNTCNFKGQKVKWDVNQTWILGLFCQKCWCTFSSFPSGWCVDWTNLPTRPQPGRSAALGLWPPPLQNGPDDRWERGEVRTPLVQSVSHKAWLTIPALLAFPQLHQKRHSFATHVLVQ